MMPNDEPMTERGRVTIYCDGSCEPNPGIMGIGVYCDNPVIRIHRVIGQGTNNQAGCLAAIAALEEAKRLGLADIELRTDSQLVVRWTTGQYGPKSSRPRRYVPRIRELLQEVGGRIRWTPGENNPADALSRQHLLQPQDFASPIERINKLTHDQLRFKDFVRLKCGRDEYSKLRYPALVERLSADDLQKSSRRLVTKANRRR